MCCNNELKCNTMKFVHVSDDGVVSTREFGDKIFVDQNIKEFVYFLKGLGYHTESIEKYIPYFEVE